MQVRCHRKSRVWVSSWDSSDHPIPAAWLKSWPVGSRLTARRYKEKSRMRCCWSGGETKYINGKYNHNSGTTAHSQVISRTLYRGRTVVPQHGRARRQGVWRVHLPGWLLLPLRWANRSLAWTLTWASCSTWPTTSRWTVVNGSDPLQWSRSNVSETPVKQQWDSLLLCGGADGNQWHAGVRGERWWWYSIIYVAPGSGASTNSFTVVSNATSQRSTSARSQRSRRPSAAIVGDSSGLCPSDVATREGEACRSATSSKRKPSGSASRNEGESRLRRQLQHSNEKLDRS